MFELEKNILLTKYPIVFYPGKKTLFYHKQYWQILPQYLAEHGNDVFHLHLPWHSSKKRLQVFKQLMKEYSGKYHLIVDDIGFSELSLIDQEKQKFIASILWVRGQTQYPLFSENNQNIQFTDFEQIPVYQIELTKKTSLTLKEKLQFLFHRLFYPNTISPEISKHIENAKLVLRTAEKCAEQDLQDSTTCDVMSL